MISTWRLGNFKSVTESREIKLAPLTVLAGPNSSGKSTLIQSLLMAAQSTTSGPADVEPLTLNGHFVRLGSLAEVRSQGTRLRTLRLGGEVDIAPGKMARVSRTGRARPSEAGSAIFQIDVNLRAGRLHVQSLILEYRSKDHFARLVASNQQESEVPEPGRVTTASLLRRRTPLVRFRTVRVQMSKSLPQDMPGFSYRPMAYRSRAVVRHVGVQLQGFLPTGLAVDQDTGVVAAEQVIEFLRTGHQYSYGPSLRLSDSVATWLTEQVALITGRPRKRRITNVESVTAALGRVPRDARRRLADDLDLKLTDEPEWVRSGLTSPSVVPLPHYLDLAADGLLDQLSGISYLGPLREDPRATYEFPPAGRRTDVGLKGQYTAAALNDFGDQVVQYHHPKSDTLERQSLRRAVDEWLRLLNLLETARSTSAGRLGHQLEFLARGLIHPVDPTFVGVGVSQALPVLVQGLLTPPGSTVLFEQPELHLHPDVQADLADFLLALARSGRQLLIESHSEHLINRLRLRVAEGSVAKGVVAIYFVTNTPSEGSQFERLDLTDAGSFHRWPKGFLDRASADAEAIIRANIRRG